MIIRTIEALFTLKSNAADFRKATSEIDRFAQNANNVLGAIAGHFAFQAISGFVTESAKAMSEVGKRAGLLGLASEELQEMRYAAQKSGVAIDTLDDSLKELQIRAVDSLSGSGEAFDAFNKLHVNPKDMFGRIRKPLEMLDEVADKLNQLPTQSERIWVVDSMFGDQGAEMLKMLKDGSAGLRKMKAEARSLGGILSAETIANSEKFNAALNQLKTSLQGTGQSMVGDLLPGLTGFSEHLARLNAGLNQIKVPIEVHRTALLSLAAALTVVAIKAAIAFMPFLAAMLPVIILSAKITALAFLVTDLWAAFQGGDTVLASLHQKLAAFFAPVDKWLVEIPGKVQAAFAGLANKIPGLKDDFSANIKSASKVYHHLEPMNTRMAPQPSNFSNHNRLTSNQSVNVAVNVKSGANPHEIGSEVSKVVRKELERERFNAFMGVSQYAS